MTRLGHVRLAILAILFYISLSSAWPWPPSLRDIEGVLLGRRASDPTGSKTSTSAPKTSKSASAASKTAKAAATSGQSASASGSGKAAASSAAATTGQAAASSIDQALPPGGMNMITPSAALASPTYYAIGINPITFAWNYTSLSITPSRVDVIVSCSANQATYTLSSNASFEKTGTAIWDTKPDETGTAPLLTETYTLIVYDAGEAFTDTPKAGQLGHYNPYQFGMYLPQKYTPRADWVCATCSSALSDLDRQAMKFMLGMCAITILSFTWFVGGFGASLL